MKLQSGNKLHHYWLSQYIKGIVLHQRKFAFEFWPIRKFHFIQPSPVPSAILNYCPIRWLLSICHLEFLSNQRWFAPCPPLWHRALTSPLLTIPILNSCPSTTLLLPPSPSNCHLTILPLPSPLSPAIWPFWHPPPCPLPCPSSPPPLLFSLPTPTTSLSHLALLPHQMSSPKVPSLKKEIWVSDFLRFLMLISVPPHMGINLTLCAPFLEKIIFFTSLKQPRFYQ